MAGFARLTGLLASIGTLALWLGLALLNPYGSGGTTQASYFLDALMMLMTGAGIVAILKSMAHVMIAVAVFSFVPVGFYMLGTPGIFKWIGILNLLFLLSSLTFLAHRLARPSSGGAS